MQTPRMALLSGAVATTLACAAATHPGTAGNAPTTATTATTETGALARIYYWRARPGKLDEYSRYVREAAEPIDHEA